MTDTLRRIAIKANWLAKSEKQPCQPQDQDGSCSRIQATTQAGMCGRPGRPTKCKEMPGTIFQTAVLAAEVLSWRQAGQPSDLDPSAAKLLRTTPFHRSILPSPPVGR
eukprot:TRINITY_DN34712_c0_g1_i1.p2 TRINITY_DN34712_c0_g1~~TRINITY_DN34712_c0_g1_i1.p2  ORF type:complete len:108 (+),score=9.24 TRINITY_DN34712_c0_g1_i1:146-469(+)